MRRAAKGLQNHFPVSCFPIAPRRYQVAATGLRAIAALLVLRNKAIKPLLAPAQQLVPTRGVQNPTPTDKNYETIRIAMRGLFDELGLAA